MDRKKFKKESIKYVKNIKKYIKDNSRYDSIDDSLLTSLEDSYATLLESKAIIDSEGLTTRNRFGDMIAHPAIKIGNDAKVQVNKALEALGVTGKQRFKSNIEVQEEESLLDKFSKEGYEDS